MSQQRFEDTSQLFSLSHQFDPCRYGRHFSDYIVNPVLLLPVFNKKSLRTYELFIKNSDPKFVTRVSKAAAADGVKRIFTEGGNKIRFEKMM